MTQGVTQQPSPNPGLRRSAAAALAALAIAGCATAPRAGDPLEGFNRAVFAFNDGLDRVAFRPAAEAYFDLVPGLVRTGVSNFFGNLADVWNAANNLLQGKGREGLDDIGRVLINSTLGLAGLVDVASDVGLEKHDEDFGQTLARWGVGDGPYVVWPFFGGRFLRDSFGLAVDYTYDVIRLAPDDPRLALRALRFTDLRAALLPAERVLDEAALDKYAYVRAAYFQRRRYLIYDGRPPREEEDEDDAVPARSAPAPAGGGSTVPESKR